MFHRIRMGKMVGATLFGVLASAVVIAAGGWAVVSGTVNGFWGSSSALMEKGAAGAGAGTSAVNHSDPPSEEEMMKKWKEMSTPGAPHEFLKQMEGKWDVSIRVWMDPNQPPQESAGTADMNMVLGGRWLKQTFHGEMMGTAFDGEGMTGYDNFRKQYINTWTDTMTTAMIINSGSLDQTGKVLTTYGTMDDCINGQIGMAVKEVLSMVDADTIHFEVHDLRIVPGQTKMMEMTYKRHAETNDGGIEMKN